MSREKFSISAGILISLSIVALCLIGYLALMFHLNNFLPLKYRLVGFGILGGFGLLFLILGILRTGLKTKVTSIFFCSLLLLCIDLAILYTHSGIRTLASIQSTSKLHLLDSSNKATHPAQETDVTKSSFVVYISGNDSYGQLEKESRSDVNILAAVNPNTKRIMLLSVPRDSYLPIAGGGQWQKDKLTHAGMYGIGSSIETLESAFDLKVNYYVRMNFTSFLNIIDVIGGIDVDNPEDFVAVDDHHYAAGHLHLNAEEALMFVRERYNLAEGDFGRQKNQERVIEAVFKKMLGVDLILRFQGIMDSVSESVETNMPANTIFDFINQQMDHGSEWKFETISIDGSSATGLPSFAMPGYDLWFFVPDEESMKEAQMKMKAVLSGQEK